MNKKNSRNLAVKELQKIYILQNINTGASEKKIRVLWKGSIFLSIISESENCIYS